MLAKGFAEKDGKPIEGYLSDEKSFNGVLFLLKEPNAGDQTSFWFKDCLAAPPEDTRQFTRYQRTFKKLLTYCDGSLQLKDCAYANIRSYNGQPKESSEYKELSGAEIVDRLYSLIQACRPHTVFVCSDMFNALIGHENISYDTGGVSYKNKSIRKRLVRLNDGDVTIYEMYHPSRGSYPDENG